jgi:glyoxylase-like metal-dependent hydrolase (beta-lactamase superfamily II)
MPKEGFMIESTTLSVDYWVFSKMSHITHCFLTHAHADHIVNLNSNWKGPKIICSEVFLNKKY